MHEGRRLRACGLGWDLWALLLDVLQREAGNLLHGFGRVGRLLDFLQCLRLLDESIDRRIVQGLPVRSKLGFLCLVLPLAKLLAGDALNDHPVVVVQEPLLDQILEHLLAIREPFLEVRQRFLEAQRLERVPAVVPILHRGEHQGQALGEAASIQLAVAELDRVDGRLHLLVLETVLNDSAKRRDHQLLYLRGVFGLQILQTHAEDRLKQSVVEPTADDPGAETAVHHGLVQWRGRRSHEQVVEE
mmetsp:Transcript_69645/g.181441  ORF Transcript_69645/g.181441 Transcript_69645/m.181441 type:complete len:245 (+) Transcript_69645:1379-2113(+)